MERGQNKSVLMANKLLVRRQLKSLERSRKRLSLFTWLQYSKRNGATPKKNIPTVLAPPHIHTNSLLSLYHIIWFRSQLWTQHYNLLSKLLNLTLMCEPVSLSLHIHYIQNTIEQKKIYNLHFDYLTLCETFCFV